MPLTEVSMERNTNFVVRTCQGNARPTGSRVFQKYYLRFGCLDQLVGIKPRHQPETQFEGCDFKAMRPEEVLCE
jgi:hypothetical protein